MTKVTFFLKSFSFLNFFMFTSKIVSFLFKIVCFFLFSGIRSKLSKVFNFVSRDRSNNQNRNSQSNITNINNNNNNNNNTKDQTKYPKGFSMLSRSDGFLNKSVVRPLEVPKLEITSPHNQDLIRKYEKRYSLGNNENTKPPALPPRRSSKQII